MATRHANREDPFMRGPGRAAASARVHRVAHAAVAGAALVGLAVHAAALQAGVALPEATAGGISTDVVGWHAWLVLLALSTLPLGVGVAWMHRSRRRAVARSQVLERQLSEATRASAALRHRSARLELAQQVAGIATFEWDLASGKIEWSPAMERLCGLEPGGFDGTFEQWRKLLHPEDAARVVKGLGNAIAGRSDLNIQLRIVRPDGGRRWLSCRTRMIHDSAGRPNQLIGTHSDMTEELQGVRTLQQSEEFFRHCADAFGGAVFDVDLAGGQLSDSRGLSLLLGWPEDGASKEIGQWLQRLHPEDAAPARDRMREAMDRGADRVELCCRVRHRDGDWRPLLIRTLLIRDRRDAVVRLVGCAEDVTALRETDTMLLREAERRRAGAGTAPEKTDLRAVVAAAAQQSEHLLRERRLELSMALPEDEVELSGEVGRLSRIFGSLMRHLAAATPPGSRLGLKLEVVGRWAIVSLRTDGNGLLPANRVAMLEGWPAAAPSGAAAARDPEIDLRMTQARTLVELQGGTLRVGSDAPGLGGHFTVTLPLTPEAARVAPTRVDTGN
jgi:PAS domain S-box-containing protein